VRWSLLTRGRMPETRSLPEPWWSTPNIHLCTLADFNALVADLDVRIEACAALSEGHPARPMNPDSVLENWRAEAALFLLAKRGAAPVEPGGVPRDLFGG
jgi:methionine biosynthesis protein MetW